MEEYNPKVGRGDRIRVLRWHKADENRGVSLPWTGIVYDTACGNYYGVGAPLVEALPDDSLLVASAWILDEEPRKDTPAVGDTVRVVLEWVTEVHDGSSLGFAYPPGSYVKSIEIISKAKPSASDLPMDSVVRDVHGAIYVKRGVNLWLSTDGRKRGNRALEDAGWALLVEKSDD